MAVVLVVGFFGCDSSVEVKDITEMPTVEAPGNLRVTAYPGVNRVTWNASANALNYDVYRYAGKGNEIGVKLTTVTLTPSPVTLHYDDVVAFNNILHDKETYTYTVVANGRYAAAARLTDWKSSSASASVRATIPELGAEIPEAPSKLNIKQFVGVDNTDYIQVSWNATPGRSYTVSYNYGSNPGVSPATTPTALISNLTPSGSIGSVIYPLLPGNNSIQIKTKLQNVGTQENYYYLPSEYVQPAAFDARIFTWPNNPGFAAARIANSLSGTANIIQLSWNVDSAVSGYEVYKAVTRNITTLVSTDWTLLAATAGKMTDGTNWYWFINDTEVEPDKEYTYLLIGKNAAGAKTLPKTTSYVITGAVSAVSLSVTGLQSIVVDENTATPKIALTWNLEAGVSYTIKRAELTYSEDGTLINPTVFTDVATMPAAGPAATNLASGAWRYVDENVAPRKSYRYEVVATKGSIVSDPAYVDEGNKPFNPHANISLSGPTRPVNRSPATFSLTLGKQYFGKELNVELSKIKLNGATADTYSPVTTFTIPATSNGSAPTGTFNYNEVLTNVSNGVYKYKIIVTDKDSGLVLKNSSATTECDVTVNIP
jgi:hypothetical protein